MNAALDLDDLYHRALTGRGAPIRSEEVLAVVGMLEEHITEHEKLEEELAGDSLDEYIKENRKARAELEEAQQKLEELEKQLEQAALARLSGDELLNVPALGVGGDKKDGLLTKGTRDAACNPFGAGENLAAVSAHGGRENLDHQPVLSSALPDAAGLEVGSAGKDVADELLDLGKERAAIKGGRKLVEASSSSGDAAADVEADGAARLEVPLRASATREDRTPGVRTSDSPSSHASKIAEDKQTLKDRAGRSRGRIWLYAAVDETEDVILLETSWLPRIPQIVETLKPLGFRHRKDGCYRAELSAKNELGVRRAVGKAFEVMLKEAER